MLLSHSFKFVLYVRFFVRTLSNRDVIRVHENAFHYFGSITDELVYDQDALIFVTEYDGLCIST